jgi:hypothetical protein
MNQIDHILRRVVDNAKSLLFDIDNNYCEQFNSIINKYIACKRLNFSQKQPYNTRVQAAIVSFNSGGEYIRMIHYINKNLNLIKFNFDYLFGNFCYVYY